MDAFRLAPAGLSEEKLAVIAQWLPAEVQTAIKTALAGEGLLKGEANRPFGPELRTALAAWVEAKGPLRP